MQNTEVTPRSPSRLPARILAGVHAHLPLLALGVACAGLFAAGVLSAGHLLDLPVPCGRSRGCTAVASHPASRVWNIPLAYLGACAYLGLILLLRHAPGSRAARVVSLALAAVGTLASAALLIVSHTVIQAMCPWCMASGAAMLLLLLLNFMLFRTPAALRPIPPAWFWSGLALTATAIGVEAGLMQRKALQPPIAAERLVALGAADLVDPRKMLGPSDAPLTIILFGDMWCPACRAVYPDLLRFQQAQPSRVRLAYRHLPLWQIRGHGFSAAAAALSEMAAERGQFWPFFDAVHAQRVQSDKEGYLHLMQALGFDPLDVERRFENPQDAAIVRVQQDIELANRLEIIDTPTFIILRQNTPPVSASLRTLPGILNSAGYR